MLRSISISNYKSLRSVDLPELQPFSVLVGANAAGKSNFIDALDFVAMAASMGLPNAVTTRGGFPNIAFRRNGQEADSITFSLTATTIARAGIFGEDSDHALRYYFDYSFTLAPGSAEVGDYYVSGERLKAYVGQLDDELLAEMSFTRRQQDYSVMCPVGPGRKSWEYAEPFNILDQLNRRGTVKNLIGRDELTLSRGNWFGHLNPTRLLIDELSTWRMYHFMPHVVRVPSVSLGSLDLGRRGENLPIALKRLSRDHPEAFEELVEHVRVAVPQIANIEPTYLDSGQVGLFFTEPRNHDRWGLHEVSDGTLQAVCLFYALLDGASLLVTIEEPERNIHPWVAKHFVDTCRLLADDKQILITTHSPSVVDLVDIDEILLVIRESGESHVTPCTDRHPEVKMSIEKALLSTGEAWTAGLIGGVPLSQQRLFDAEEELHH